MKIGSCSHFVCLIALAAFAPVFFGCSPSVGASSGVRLNGINTQIGLRPRLATKAYLSTDSSGASMYFTDLSDQALTPGSDLTGVSGTIVHIHLFAIPKAGKTPIDRTASTATVRTLVLAEGHIGVYGGGGFMMPSGKPGERSFGGSISNASIRLTGSTPGFEDRIGAGEFSASVAAPLDEAVARRIATRLEELIRFTTPVEIGERLTEPEERPAEEPMEVDDVRIESGSDE